MRTRIAPTPSGLLHIGNGAAFVLAWQLAREARGKLLLRIDDLDSGRTRPEYVQDIFDTLAWLGIDWDEGPRDASELAGEWSQHRRLADYHKLLGMLRSGGHLYACGCSRSQIIGRGAATEYDGHCRNLGSDLDAPDVAWRLRLPEGGTVALREWPTGAVRRLALDQPDPVLRQRNGQPAYQVASLADDVRFGIDLVVRGSDLLPSTAVQCHMAELLGLGKFNQALFLHHPLVLDEAGHKRSKSHGAGSLRAAREAGMDPREVHRLAGMLLQEAWHASTASGAGGEGQ